MNIKYVKKMLMDQGNILQIDNIIDKINNSDVEHAKTRADELLKNTFVFDNNWDMERCIYPITMDQIDFFAIQNNDEEWTFMLNRMEYLNHLINYYAYSKQQKYADKWIDIVMLWVDNHKIIKPKISCRTLDTAIRIDNIKKGLVVLNYYQQLSDEQLSIIVSSINDQLVYLKDNYLNKYTLSNWGIIQTCIIMINTPIFVENYQDDEVFIFAQKELKTQFEIQINEDGNYWEQSVMYHVEVLNYGLKLINNNRFYELDNNVYKSITKLAYTLLYQMTPQHYCENYGDSDRCMVDDILAKAAYVLNDSVLKNYSLQEFDIEMLFEYGYNASLKFKDLNCDQCDKLLYNGVDSGMVISRSSFDVNANYTFFTNGSLGSGHGHCDNNHFSIYLKGKPFLVDNGRYTYRENDPLRIYFKSVKAHNSVVIDDEDHSICDSSWGNSKYVNPVKNYVNKKDNITYIEGVYIADIKHEKYIHTRKIVFLDMGIWHIVDYIQINNEHIMNTYFHLDYECLIDKGTNNSTYILNNGEQTLNVEFDSCACNDVISTQTSLKYNELNKSNCIVSKDIFDNNFSKCSKFYDANIVKETENIGVYQDGNENVLDNVIASATKYVMDSNHYYIIVIVNNEIYNGRKLFYVEKQPIFAKCVVIEYIDGTYHQKVLKR